MAGPLQILGALGNGAVTGWELGQQNQKLKLQQQAASDAHLKALADQYTSGLTPQVGEDGSTSFNVNPDFIDPNSQLSKFTARQADLRSQWRVPDEDVSGYANDPSLARLNLGTGPGQTNPTTIKRGGITDKLIDSYMNPVAKNQTLNSQQLKDYQEGKVATDKDGNPINIPADYVKGGAKPQGTPMKLGDWAAAMGHKLGPDADSNMIVPDASTARALMAGWKPAKPVVSLTPDQMQDYEKANGAGSSANLTPGGYFNWKNAQARANTAAGNFDITRGDAEAGKLNTLAQPIQKIQAGLEATRSIYDLAETPNKLDEGTLAGLKAIAPFLGVQGMRAYNSIMKMQQGSGHTLAGDVNSVKNYVGWGTPQPTSASPETIAAYRDSAIKMADDLEKKLGSAKTDFTSKAPITAQSMAKIGTLNANIPNYYQGADSALADMHQRKSDWLENPRSGLNRKAPQNTLQSVTGSQNEPPSSAPAPNSMAGKSQAFFRGLFGGQGGDRSPQSMPSDGMDDSTVNLGGGGPEKNPQLVTPAPPPPQPGPSEIRANRAVEPQIIGQASQAVEQARQNILQQMGTAGKGARPGLQDESAKMDLLKQDILDRLSSMLGRDVYEHEIDKAPVTGNGPAKGHDPMFGGH